jgi:hypothetical protein
MDTKSVERRLIELHEEYSQSLQRFSVLLDDHSHMVQVSGVWWLLDTIRSKQVLWCYWFLFWALVVSWNFKLCLGIKSNILGQTSRLDNCFSFLCANVSVRLTSSTTIHQLVGQITGKTSVIEWLTDHSCFCFRTPLEFRFFFKLCNRQLLVLIAGFEVETPSFGCIPRYCCVVWGTVTKCKQQQQQHIRNVSIVSYGQRMRTRHN